MDYELGTRGVETQAIAEFYGEFRTRKTQLSHQLSVNAQLLDGENGQKPHVIYIDTEHTFRPERIEQMAEAANLNPGKMLSLGYLSLTSKFLIPPRQF